VLEVEGVTARDGCLWRPQDNVRLAFLRENGDVDLGIGGTARSKDLSFDDFRSSRCDASVDDGVVEAALSRDESAVDAVLVFDAPLPLHTKLV
jgi:hypothetical protein